jgi:hypothetical protein
MKWAASGFGQLARSRGAVGLSAGSRLVSVPAVVRASRRLGPGRAGRMPHELCHEHELGVDMPEGSLHPAQAGHCPPGAWLMGPWRTCYGLAVPQAGLADGLFGKPPALEVQRAQW